MNFTRFQQVWRLISTWAMKRALIASYKNSSCQKFVDYILMLQYSDVKRNEVQSWVNHKKNGINRILWCIVTNSVPVFHRCVENTTQRTHNFFQMDIFQLSKSLWCVTFSITWYYSVKATEPTIILSVLVHCQY